MYSNGQSTYMTFLQYRKVCFVAIAWLASLEWIVAPTVNLTISSGVGIFHWVASRRPVLEGSNKIFCQLRNAARKHLGASPSPRGTAGTHSVVSHYLVLLQKGAMGQVQFLKMKEGCYNGSTKHACGFDPCTKLVTVPQNIFHKNVTHNKKV